jgi:aspartate carbamoyltransferase catalytic subunit
MSVVSTMELLRTRVQLSAPPPLFNGEEMIFEKGQKVKVISHINTDREYGMNDHMFKMIDTIQTVKFCDATFVSIDGYYWSLKDIVHVEEKEKDPQIFHFDPSNLEV